MTIRYVIFDASLVPMSVLDGHSVFESLEDAEKSLQEIVNKKGGLYTILKMYYHD